MRNKISVIISFLFLNIFCVRAQVYQAYQDYVSVFARTAVEQMEEHGIPASITLAQGLLESAAGKSDLTKRSNNHFGIKCTSDWTGPTTSHDDDKKGDCFRVYDDPADSYRDHSLFLKRPHYAPLFELSKTDYKGWAHGLKRCGYATDPAYPTKLIKLIEDYDLARYDKMKASQVEEPTEELVKQYTYSVKKKTNTVLPFSKTTQSKQTQSSSRQSTTTTRSSSSESSMGTVSATRERKIHKANKCKYIIARENDTYAIISKEYNIAESRLRSFNEAGKLSEPRQGERIYLENKRNKGETATHKVKKGETMRDISQAEGIKLKKLYEYNTIPFGDQPEEGQTIRLKR